MTEPIEPNIRDEFAAQEPSVAELNSGSALGINFAELLEETRDMNLTEDQAHELLQAYINVAVHYSLMGFGLHPAQLVSNSDQTQEKSELSADFLASAPDDVVQLQYDSAAKTSEEFGPEGGGR